MIEVTTSVGIWAFLLLIVIMIVVGLVIFVAKVYLGTKVVQYAKKDSKKD